MDETKQTIYDIYLEMVATGVIEDRTEYDLEDLKSTYDLTDEEAYTLLGMIDNQDVAYITNKCVETRYKRTTVEALQVLENCTDPVTAEYFGEADHSGWDGWTQENMPIVLSLLHDLATYHANHPKNNGEAE